MKKYQRTEKYDNNWIQENWMGPNPLILLEELCEHLDLKPEVSLESLFRGLGANLKKAARTRWQNYGCPNIIHSTATNGGVPFGRKQGFAKSPQVIRWMIPERYGRNGLIGALKTLREYSEKTKVRTLT